MYGLGIAHLAAGQLPELRTGFGYVVVQVLQLAHHAVVLDRGGSGLGAFLFQLVVQAAGEGIYKAGEAASLQILHVLGLVQTRLAQLSFLSGQGLALLIEVLQAFLELL